MATTLLEKRLLDYKDKQTKNLSLNEIFVSYHLGKESGPERSEKSLSELFVRVKKGDKSIVRPVSSYQEFVNEYAKANVFVEKTGLDPLPKDGKVVLFGENYVNRTSPYYAVFDIPETYDSKEELPQTNLKSGKVSSSAVPYGLSRTMKVQENEITSANNYLLITLEGSSKQEFVKKSDIYYVDGARIVYLYENNKKIDFNKVKGKTLYVGNKIIDRIYTEKEYTFDEYQKFEKLNVEELKKESFELIKEPTPEQIEKVKTGEVVELDGAYYAKTSSVQQDAYYTEQTHKVLTVPDAKKPGKSKDEAYYSVKVYEINGSGNYIKLRMKGGNKVEMVDISTLCDEAGNPIEKDKIKNFVGKSIKIKTENGMFETENLTLEQANYFYEKHFNYEPSISKNDALEDNAYLQTKDGHFVEEGYVRPISYKFTKKDKCDAYLIKIETSNGVQEKIVKAEDYTKIHNKYKIKAKYKLETCSFNNADVVQTSTNSSSNKALIEDCKVLKSYNAEKDVFEDLTADQLTAEQQAILEKFKEAYLNGQYNVDHLYIDGKKVELDPRLKRFIYTDEHLMKDYADDTLSYSGLKKSSVTYESENGKLGKFKGNAKLSFGKICKQAYAIWAKSLVYYIGISMSGAGLLAALAAPALVVGAAAALVAAPVLIPPIAGIACLIKNVLNKPFKDKTKYNRKKWNKNFEKELAAINQNMHDTDLTKGYHKDVFLAKMDRLKSDILAGSKSTVGNGFQVIDGKIAIDGENVNQVKAFKKQHKKELSNLKSRKKEVKKAKRIYDKLKLPFASKEEEGLELNVENPQYQKYLQAKRNYEDLADLYDNEEASFNRKMASHNSEALTYDKDKKLENNLKRADRLKNFWLVKKFTSKEELLENRFTEEEIKQLQTLDYDPNKDLFITKDGNYVADTVKPKVELYTETVIIPDAKKETVDLLTKLKNLMDKQNQPKEVEVPVVEDVVEEEAKEPVVEEIVEDTKEPLEEVVEETIDPANVKEEPVVEQEEVKSSKTQMETIYGDYGITRVNKNGSLPKSKDNLEFVLKCMKRCTVLAKKQKLGDSAKQEYRNLKHIIKANEKLIDDVINKFPDGKNPKYVTAKKFEELRSARLEMLDALHHSGNIVSADGHIEIV